MNCFSKQCFIISCISVPFFQKIFSFRGMSASAIFAVGCSLSASGQDGGDQRLDSKLNRRAVESLGERTQSFKEGLDISLISSLAYDDNIFQEANDETSSVVAQLEPSVGWTKGSKNGTWIRLAYEGTAILYLAQTEDSRIDHNFSAEGGVKGKALALAYSASWAKVGSPSADIGGASDRFQYGGRAEVTYTPKGKVSYALYVDGSVIDQEEAAFFDFYQASGGISARYRHSRKTEVSAAYSLGQVRVDGAGTQTFHRLGLQAIWKPRSKVSVSLEGGAEYRDYEDGSGLSPYFSARVDWTPRAKTAFFLEAYRREEASGAVEGENFDVYGFRAGVSQELRDGWSVGFELGSEKSDYFDIVGLPESGREDTIFFVRPSVRYRFGEDSEVVFLYQYITNDSTDSNFGYDNSQLGVSLNYKF